ncbi:MAG: enolase [Thermoplasmata archaeon]
MSTIRSVDLAGIFDSRGRPTVEATVRLDSGATGRAGAPSGASTGIHEVTAFPPGGVPEAIARFSAEVAPRLVGLDATGVETVDRTIAALDGTPQLSRIGGNVATAVSVATATARAQELGRPLWEVLRRPGVDGVRFPAVVGNCLNGGVHAVNGPEIQECIAFAEGRSIDESIRAAIDVHRRIGAELHRRYPAAALGRGDEGGWVAAISSAEAVEILAAACAASRDELGISVHPGIDMAASELYHDGRYRYRDRSLDPAGQLGFVVDLIDRHGLRFVEDPFDQEAFAEFGELTRQVGRSVLVVGDDIYVTQRSRIERGLSQHASNGVLIKVNQVGSLTGTFAACDAARAAGASLVASHRSGETPDAWLAHVALGIGARGIKTGVLGGERMAKLNELLRLARARGA